MINQLLRKGFKSTHIAEFFAGVREGHSLGDILGFQQAMLGGWTDKLSAAVPSAAARVAPLLLEVESGEAQRLVELGVARVGDQGLEFVDPVIAEIIARAPDQTLYLHAILQVYESTKDTIDQLAGQVVNRMKSRPVQLHRQARP